MKVYVDADRCQGHARCLARAPEAFVFLNLEDRAEVSPSAVGTVPLAVFERAASECPERAIIIDY